MAVRSHDQRIDRLTLPTRDKHEAQTASWYIGNEFFDIDRTIYRKETRGGQTDVYRLDYYTAEFVFGSNGRLYQTAALNSVALAPARVPITGSMENVAAAA